MVGVRLLTNTFKLNILKIDYLRLSKNIQTKSAIKTEKTKIRRKHIKEIDKYLSENPHILDVKADIPVRFLKKNRKAPDDLYLIDKKKAAEIAAIIKPYILDSNKSIIETNPGLCFLTKHLLDAGLKRLQIYESTVCFRGHILKLDNEFPGKLQVYNRDFFSIWNLSYQDRHDNGDRVKKMLSGVNVKEWSDAPAMTIIGTLASTNFIRHLMLSLIFQFGIMTYGRCELLLTLPPPLYIQLTCGPETGYLLYRPSSVIFQILCEHEVLYKIPRKSYLPWDSTFESINKSKYKKLYSIDPDYMYLTRIIFKKDLPIPLNRLQHLWYFVHHMMLSRKCKVIPAIEKWIPGSGIRLILASSSKNSIKDTFPDMNIFTESGELTPVQMLKLFKIFSSWPEFLESPFIASMEAALLKMDSISSFNDPMQVTEEESIESKLIKTDKTNTKTNTITNTNTNKME